MARLLVLDTVTFLRAAGLIRVRVNGGRRHRRSTYHYPNTAAPTATPASAFASSMQYALTAPFREIERMIMANAKQIEREHVSIKQEVGVLQFMVERGSAVSQAGTDLAKEALAATA